MNPLRWTPLLRVAALAALAALLGGVPVAHAAAKAAATCASCHPDFKSVLPATHPAVAGKTLGACVACHKTGQADKVGPDRFTSTLHRAHATGDCLVCHSVGRKGAIAFVAGKVALPVSAAELEALKPVMASWATSQFQDAVHGKGSVDCAGCHGAGVPAPGADVGNDRCLACHGPLDRLVEKTAPAQFPDRNPHRSHLGEIACTVCHKGHEASVVYCLDCHRKFEIRFKATSAKGVR